MRIAASGFGAGTHEIDGLPNCTEVVVGESLAVAESPGQPVMLLEANLDDATGEVLAHTVEALLEAGAYDAWITPIVMKKGRPGHLVSVLVDPALTEATRATLQAETGTLGVRGALLQRWPAARVMDHVEVDGALVQVKISPGRVKVEQRDAARVASRRRLPLREVLHRAESVWRQEGESRPPDRSPPTLPPDSPAPA
jgi:hypothetical protein